MYKCNANPRSHQFPSGNWEDFFAEGDAGDGCWGGTWSIKNKQSRKILLKEMRPGDLIIAFQSDQRGAIGLCRVRALPDEGGERHIILKPVLHFEAPVPLHDLKEVDERLKEVGALKPGFPQTLYPIFPEEAGVLARHLPEEAGKILRQYGVATCDEPLPMDYSPAEGGGFGSPENNKQIEQAAVKAVTTWYRKRGWLVRSVERDKIGFDLLCSRRSKEEHVEVKGVSGEEPDSFVLTAGEVKRAESDPAFILCVVTTPLSSPLQHWFRQSAVLRDFDVVPIQYMARRRM
jgi:hypothetical protein